jgi:diguanylate cyclase (GGDEF)-like protein/PAS domain S-box-containing protein
VTVRDKHKVLVVDDDDTLRFLAREALEQAGFDVEEAENGAVALEVARGAKPDLILLDVQMPVMSGFEVCEQLRADEAFMHVPILMATGLDDVTSIETAYRLGATNFITKPLRWNTLPYDIRYILRNSTLEDDLRRENAERVRVQGVLHASEIRYRRLFEEAGDGILLLDLDSELISDVNDSFVEMFGIEREEVVGRKLSEIAPLRTIADSETALEELRSQQQVRFEHWALQTAQGSPLDVEFLGIVYQVDDAKVVQCNFRDITERKQAEARIQYMALHDALTGLPNRTLLQDLLTHAIAGARRAQERVAVLMIDLDRFKCVNDSLGHQIGDGLLEAAAIRLRNRMRDSDIVCRLGGDEFVIVLSSIFDDRDAGAVAQGILSSFELPFEIDSHVLHVGASIGISRYPADGGDPGTLLRAADIAMYEAKGAGRGTFMFFTPALNEAAQSRLALTNDLRRAAECNEFVLHYQPQVSMRSGVVTGFEALLRWNHPELGLIAPSRFVPLLEETGLIVEVGEWVLRTACQQAMKWQAEGLPPMRIAVNLSAYQFNREDVVRVVDRALRDSGLRPELLDLELTESLTLDDTERAILTMHHLKRLGVTLSIDDFGTGWSSLSYLRRFPLDRIKIDRSFMRDVVSDPTASALVRSIITLGKTLGLGCVAEGVETFEQFGYMKQLLCSEVQGFLFSPAVPNDQVAELLRTVQQLYKSRGAA